MAIEKITWTLLEISSIFLYILFIGFGYLLQIAWVGWLLFFAMMILHLFEMQKAFEVGRKKGLDEHRIVLKNMLFGFTWWLPLERGIFEK